MKKSKDRVTNIDRLNLKNIGEVAKSEWHRALVVTELIWKSKYTAEPIDVIACQHYTGSLDSLVFRKRAIVYKLITNVVSFALCNNQHQPHGLIFGPLPGNSNYTFWQSSHLRFVFMPLTQFVCLFAENSLVVTLLHLKKSTSPVLPVRPPQKSVSTSFFFPQWKRPATLARSVQQHPVNLISVIRRSLKQVSPTVWISNLCFAHKCSFNSLAWCLDVHHASLHKHATLLFVHLAD